MKRDAYVKNGPVRSVDHPFHYLFPQYRLNRELFFDTYYTVYTCMITVGGLLQKKAGVLLNMKSCDIQ